MKRTHDYLATVTLRGYTRTHVFSAQTEAAAHSNARHFCIERGVYELATILVTPYTPNREKKK